jgi:hypothetical protein
MPRKQAETTDSVVFNGITFRRYPLSKRESDRRYYRADGRLRKQGISYLHHEIWKAYHGEIPEGFHVHHKDGNTLNNDISNLELLPGSKHLSQHTTKRWENPTEHQLEVWKEVQDKAKEWHKSEAGREWHKQHAKEIAEHEKAKPKVKLVCAVCGKEYFVTSMRRDMSRFCSNACYAKYRRDSGIDNEDRTCVICGKTFNVNRFSKQKTCGSKECHTKAMLASRAATYAKRKTKA